MGRIAVAVYAPLFAACISSVSIILPSRANAQSFNCAEAKTASARLICADAELSQLDRQLSAAFQKRKNELAVNEQRKFVTDEVTWIRERNRNCGLVGKDTAATEALLAAKPCMTQAIQERIAALSQVRQGPPSDLQRAVSGASTLEGKLQAARLLGIWNFDKSCKGLQYQFYTHPGEAPTFIVSVPGGAPSISQILSVKVEDDLIKLALEQNNAPSNAWFRWEGEKLRIWHSERHGITDIENGQNVREGSEMPPLVFCHANPPPITADQLVSSGGPASPVVSQFSEIENVQIEGCRSQTMHGVATATVKSSAGNIFLDDGKLIPLLRQLWQKAHAACESDMHQNLVPSNATIGTETAIVLHYCVNTGASVFVGSCPGYDVGSVFRSADGVNFTGSNNAAVELRRLGAQAEQQRKWDEEARQRELARQRQQEQFVAEQQQGREAAKHDFAMGVDGLVGTWRSDNNQFGTYTITIRKEGAVYFVHTSDGQDFAGPYKDNQLQLNSVRGNITVSEATGELLFTGARFARISK